MRRSAWRFDRRALVSGLVLLLVLSAAAGCSSTRWVKKAQLAPIRLQPRVVIMLWKSEQVRQSDDEGFAEAVATALQVSLGERGYETTVTPLAGEPRLPRVELAIQRVEYGSLGRAKDEQGLFSGFIVVDCAYVSADDQISFIGRLTASGKDGNLGYGSEAAGQAIAEALLAP